MKRKLIFIVAAILIAGVVACQKQSELKVSNSDASKPAASKTAEGGETQHAGAEVKPGTYEDWCGEHQVPESMCTRCNPSLIAAFKATNDWCEEHGLPESQCLICNPSLKIERPPKAEGAK
jgi:hypothetical protein